MKKRILSGLQPSGNIHIGNYFGFLKSMIEYQDSSDLLFFVANLHSLTSANTDRNLKELTIEALIDAVSLGINPNKATIFVQSDINLVTNLAWILSSFSPVSLMEKAHSYKDKVAKGISPNMALFNYPILMAADILIYQTEIVPVGKDQKQHLEIARDLAIKFNNVYGDIFTIPEADISEDLGIIPGTDGQKMSKSYNNTIEIFADQKDIKKAVMGIETDSKSLEDKKKAEGNNIYEIYKVFANKEELLIMKTRFEEGGFGYGEAKKILLEKILAYFKEAREKKIYYKNHQSELIKIVEDGSIKVNKIAEETMQKVYKSVGLKY